MPPPPLPITTPAPGSPTRSPASRHASRPASTPKSAARRIAPRIGARLPVDGVLAVDRHRRRDVHRRHVGGDATRVVGGVEGRDRPRAADAVGHSVPEHVPANAVGRDDTNSGDDDARCGHAAVRGRWRSYNTCRLAVTMPFTDCSSRAGLAGGLAGRRGIRDRARRLSPLLPGSDCHAGPGAWRLAAALAGTAGSSSFAAHHSVMARTGAKAWSTQWLPAAYERTAYVWIRVGAAGAGHHGMAARARRNLPGDGPLAWRSPPSRRWGSSDRGRGAGAARHHLPASGRHTGWHRAAT